ncbi:hypothetical protein B0T18DRAFT_393746 [Schizothecium vesticola]|uniref:Uncharacterized protein n=1 Tax=Schizothecium vesticola TaxID=314040 RepID=A0AA40EKK1_9PEZI|nr:hypothetical protein B0T18DRAFT_393746 [Schizothecium vesticola]
MVIGSEFSILDIMSSPDPLNESGPGPTPLTTASSRRVTRSQASQRTHSFYTSPRKQTFSLDVGNEISPQKILVTVQTEDASDDAAHTVNRRLFQSPTPRRAVRQRASSKTASNATTTTVPLRGLSDDEAEGATPKRRGRPRKAATPAATQRKRPGTPLARKAIQQSRATRSSTNSVATSDMSDDSQATPRAARATKRKASSPAKEATSSAARPAKRGRPSSPVKEAPSSVTRSAKRGRPRKTVQESVEQTALSEQESAADAEVEDNASVAQVEDNISAAGSRVGENLSHPGADDMEEDIWLATLSEEATPVARRSYRAPETATAAIPEQPTRPSQREATRSEPPQSEPPQSEADSIPEGGYDDYGYMDPQSDVESLASDSHAQNDVEDTVVAEEFTMISVGSLPSMMQLNSSMMGAHPQDVDEDEEEPEEEELGEATSLIINGALESLRQSLNKRNQESTQDNQPPAVDESAPPEPAQQQPERPPSKPTSPQVPTKSPRRPAKVQPLGRQLALKSLQGSTADSPARASGPTVDEHQEPSAYDDSFSEIPEAVLAAATPKRLRKPAAEPENELPRLDIQPSIERPSSVNHSNPQSETNRLLTPDETPSPVPSDDGHEAAPDKSSLRNANTVDDEMRSSPPLPLPSPQQQRNIPVIRHTRTRSYETPTEQPSTYISPAMAVLKAHHAQKANHAHLAPPEHHSRAMLSPIVRAGRALQAVTSDPPSPPGRGSVLRSPFRSSVARSQSPAQQQVHEPSREPSREVSRQPSREPLLEPVQESPREAVTEQPRETTEDVQSPQPAPVESARTERSWLAPLSHLRNFVVQGAQALSPRQTSVAGMDDPFAPSPSDATRFSIRNSLFGSASRQSSHQNVEPEAPSSERAAAMNDEYDEMSWQVEEPVEEQPRQDFASQQSNMYTGRRSTAQDAAVSRTIEVEEEYERDNEQEAEIEQDQGMAEPDNGDDYEEEDDIWAFEARRSLPSKAKEAEPQRQPTVSPPRRAKLPSPWRQNSQRLTYKDELHRYSVNKAPQKEAEDYSLLAQQSRNEKPAALAGQVPATTNVNLSAFFSSPAVLPQVEAPTFGLSKALDGRKPAQPVQQKAAQSSLRASVAQRSLPSGIDAQRSLPASVAQRNQPVGGQEDTRESRQSFRASVSQGNESADIERDTQQSAGVSTAQRHQGFGNVQPARQSTFRPQREERQPPSRGFQLGRNLLDVESPFMAAPEPSPERRPAPARQPSPPPSDMSAFSHVPQKMNFTPRTQNASKRLFQPPSQSLFGPSPAAVLFGGPAPREREVTPDPASLAPRHRAMSPSKSCLRSPLKGKTPGRVVEFASSTLSPLQQAQVRAERRSSSASPEKQLSSGAAAATTANTT